MTKSIVSFIFVMITNFAVFNCMENGPKIDKEFEISSNKVIDVQQFQVFPSSGKAETDQVKFERWRNIKKAFDYCIENKDDLYFPKGIYDVGVRNFPFRKEITEGTELLDCNFITIFGDGKETVLKTSSALGADVLQLNLLKNVTIKNFSITADLSSTKKAGSNGISITNGFDNIVLDNIYIYDLPGVDKGTYIDGGKGLTVQFGTNLKSLKGSLVATNINVENCAYGFRFDAITVSDLLKENFNIKIQIKADRTFRGFSMSFGAPVENVKPGAKIKMDVDAIITNSQQYIIFSRVVGGDYRFTVDKTIDNSYINKDRSNKVWYKADQRYFGFLSNYSKYTNTTIKGNVGAVDSKIWMGAVGSVVEPFNLKNSTEANIFNFDIQGTSSDQDFKMIEYQGNSINNSKFDFSPRTLKKQPSLNKIEQNNNAVIIK